MDLPQLRGLHGTWSEIFHEFQDGSLVILIHYDYSDRRYVMLKIFIQASSMGQQVDNELNMYRHMEQSPTAHPGRDAIRTLLDTFYIDGPQDKHRCLVHPPLWESVLAFLRRKPVERLPSAVITVVLHRLFLALDYLHTECHIAHTGL